MKKIIISMLLVSFINHAKAITEYDKCINRFASIFHESESGKLNALYTAYAKGGNHGKN